MIGAAAAAVVAMCGCGGTTSARQIATARQQRSEAILVALLADRRLVEVSPESGRVLARASVGVAAPSAAATGAYIAAPQSGKRFFVLVPYAGGRKQDVQEIAASDLTTLRSYRLPGGIVFRSLETSRDGKRLYVLGNRGEANQIGAPMLAVIDTASGRLLAKTTLRASAGRHWLVFDAALSADGNLLAVSYHGPDTTGADWLRLNQISKRCTDRTPPAVACLSLHGEVAFRGHDIVATTGEGPLVERTLRDRLVRSWASKLPRNHLTRLALDASAKRAAVIGGCDYTGGLSVISLVTGATTRIGYPEKVCGEEVVFVDEHIVAVARNALSVPNGAPSRIDLVDVRRRLIDRRIATASDVLDIAVIR
jgi:hypothetical protein